MDLEPAAAFGEAKGGQRKMQKGQERATEQGGDGGLEAMLAEVHEQQWELLDTGWVGGVSALT